ncbi:unnamed protein product [Arctia plantaginis]|uniref:Fatty acyl-CoA reductase n=1 Tax=Arctia plantaginis TaxID=874455 RepID=A0A8S1BCF8_ARCPL|nr:unnamed protein product [Arctia plantaginis]
MEDFWSYELHYYFSILRSSPVMAITSELGNGELLDPAQEFEARLLKRNEVIHEATKPGNSDVQKFYKGLTVFVTGGSGYLGKQLIEKLLRATNVSKLFILMRSKKGIPITQRLNEMLDNPVYDLVRELHPGFEQKIVLVEGDIGELRLGLSDEDWSMLTSQTEVIFHLAATTRFDEPLCSATLIIARGTRETLKLGKECSNLKSFVYVSTAYSQAISSRIKDEVFEDFYPSPIDPEAMIRMAETLEENKLNNITKSLIEGWPNTYTFAKAVTEKMVQEAGKEMPICVVRPGIVTVAIREPNPGWVDLSNMYGASGIALGVGVGVMHVAYVNTEARVGVIPPDYVNNAVIAAGYETARRRSKGDMEPKVYTVLSSTRTKITCGYFTNGPRNAIECCTPKLVWYNFVIETSNKILFWILTWILHLIPAYIIDGVCWILGKERKLVKVYTKMYKLSTALGYFTTNDWEFQDKNLATLFDSLSPTDKEIFDFNVETIDWQEYVLIYGLGIRKYILKDESGDSCLEQNQLVKID